MNWNRFAAATAVMLLSLPALAGPQEALAAALAHARTLPSGIREQTRYLALYSIPADKHTEARKVLAFHCNSLSREAEPIQPVLVAPGLLAITLADYGWSSTTWEKLADTDPYLHVTITVKTPWIGGIWPGDGKVYSPGAFTVVSQRGVLAPWLDTKQATELALYTQSKAPLLRADWFLAQTAIQEGRKVGYYDMLGLGKKKKDFDDLVGLDVKAAQRVRKEIAAIVQTSSVALNNRHLFRFQTLTGPYWETRDSKESTDKRNAIRLLNGDFTFDAQEIYGTLPNGLFAFFLSDAQGNRANTAPDFIASDGKSSSTDRRVHVGLSCVRCHVPGIQPIDDWARRLYRGNLQLQTVDPLKFVRLRQLYLSDLDRHVTRDQSDYAEALKRTNGLTPAANAAAYATFWDRYQQQPITLTDACRELGVTEQRLTDAIWARVKRGLADPVLAGLVQQPSIPLRREHWEEIQPTIWEYLGNRP